MRMKRPANQQGPGPDWLCGLIGSWAGLGQAEVLWTLTEPIWGLSGHREGRMTVIFLWSGQQAAVDSALSQPWAPQGAWHGWHAQGTSRSSLSLSSRRAG